VVGERGPGGGIVYYVSATTFTSTGSNCNTSCRYLEVAPATWQTGVVANDQLYAWSSAATATGQDITTTSAEGAYRSDETINWKIGQGFNNTRLMNTGGASAAATAVLAYAGNSTAGQWFIPSMNELVELCKYARGLTTGNPAVGCSNSGTLKTGTDNDLGGFVADRYWSSTERAADSPWFVNFTNNFTGYTVKSSPRYVRPVRAF
jgi:hypothetical protein